jgi:hypothetical protein
MDKFFKMIKICTISPSSKSMKLMNWIISKSNLNWIKRFQSLHFWMMWLIMINLMTAQFLSKSISKLALRSLLKTLQMILTLPPKTKSKISKLSSLKLLKIFKSSFKIKTIYRRNCKSWKKRSWSKELSMKNYWTSW